MEKNIPLSKLYKFWSGVGKSAHDRVVSAEDFDSQCWRDKTLVFQVNVEEVQDFSKNKVFIDIVAILK
jgi:hypothetical protein